MYCAPPRSSGRNAKFTATASTHPTNPAKDFGAPAPRRLSFPKGIEWPRDHICPPLADVCVGLLLLLPPLILLTTSVFRLLLLLHWRWIILQQLGNCLSQVLLTLVWLGVRVQCLARCSAPHQVFVGRVIHIQR